MFQSQEISSILANIESGLKESEGKVDTIDLATFEKGITAMEAAASMVGLKVEDELGEVRIFRALISALKTHSVLVLKLVFPNGNRWETVSRLGNDGFVRDFAYKL